MAKIIVGSYLVRFPLGGYFSWVLQWLNGFSRLGHEVYFVEKASWENACFDASQGTMGNDGSYGLRILHDTLKTYGLENNWCFVDVHNNYFGLNRQQIETIFRSADLLVDMGSHGSWLPEAAGRMRTVLIDGEPGTTQMRMEQNLHDGRTVADYDVYYTVGTNLGSPDCSAPSAGKTWRPIFDPVNVDNYSMDSPPSGAPFTTIMSWQAYEPIAFNGQSYGQKDVEFAKFIDLPRLTDARLEIAVAGANVPIDELSAVGWQVQDAHSTSISLQAFNKYIRQSAGEFTVCKNVFVATNSGWFSDRSAIYLACGRPVVMQDTGFSKHLPCGRGLFAVNDPTEAAAAIDMIRSNADRQSKWAREIAMEFLDAQIVLRGLLTDVGIS